LVACCYVFQIVSFQNLDFCVEVDVEVTATSNLKDSVFDEGLHFFSLQVDLHSTFYRTCGEETGIDCENQMTVTSDDVWREVGSGFS
jgi:hypothetical protein